MLVIPVLRVIGMGLLALCVLLNDAVLLNAFSWAPWLRLVLALELYGLVSWLLLYAFFDRLRPFDLGLFFLVADLAVLAARGESRREIHRRKPG